MATELTIHRRGLQSCSEAGPGQFAVESRFVDPPRIFPKFCPWLPPKVTAKLLRDRTDFDNS